MKPLGLEYQKIDMCLNFCMLYYLENVELIECITCGHSRYKSRTSKENPRKEVFYHYMKSYSPVDNGSIQL